MQFNRWSFLKGAATAAGASAFISGSAGAKPVHAKLDDRLELDGSLEEIVVTFRTNDRVTDLDRFDLADGYYQFEVLPFGYTRATAEQVRRIVQLQSVRRITPNYELEYFNDDAREETGAEAVAESLGYDGTHGHVAVVDTGIGAPHPDHRVNVVNDYEQTPRRSSFTPLRWSRRSAPRATGASTLRSRASTSRASSRTSRRRFGRTPRRRPNAPATRRPSRSTGVRAGSSMSGPSRSTRPAPTASGSPPTRSSSWAEAGRQCPTPSRGPRRRVPDERPDRLVVVVGGYIAVEMSYFFSQMGPDVAIIGHGDVLVDREDPDVADHVTDVYGGRHELHLGDRANEIAETDDGKRVTAEDDDSNEVSVTGDRLLLATGRRPNSDTWNVEAAGIETDDEGFVETDEYFETSVDDVYAIGDVAGNYPFKHSGDKEAECVVDAVVHGEETPVEYPGMAHAILGSPQVAGLGDTEDDLEGEAGEDYRVGTCGYDDTALGETLDHEGGFAKVLVDPDGEVLGCHVVGPDASTLIHEVSTALAAGADAETIAETIHVHPALSEVVQAAFRDAVDVAPSGI